MFEIRELYDSGHSDLIAYVEAKTKEKAYKKAGVLNPSGYTPITELSKEKAKQIKLEYFKKYSTLKLEIKALKNYKNIDDTQLLNDLIAEKKGILKYYKKMYCFKIEELQCSQM